jgi:hypothetical protein
MSDNERYRLAERIVECKELDGHNRRYVHRLLGPADGEKRTDSYDLRPDGLGIDSMNLGVDYDSHGQVEDVSIYQG